ncbi:hypothetical protein CBI38_33470 (plasmid) [Rhodococcus oxybenzonivorans]|uniref:Uncharacterized protein n=1 Tax=Rhodococcus oxybenzonivorans TaxID=1990687 RepID=A0A2S2C685_9NOCA|nr:hypothetical protein CBI38_33470 [Rhodococcus oxybenzonivorans]
MQQFIGEFGYPFDLGYGLNGCECRFTHLVVGDPDHRNIEDFWVAGQRVLDLLERDVDTAGDDP